MTTYPHLALSQIELDVELARRLPRKLAYYHLALPLSSDGNELSVSLAEPEDTQVVEMLARLFGAKIVPVHSSAQDIRAALDRLWQAVRLPPPHILTWGDSPARAESAREIGSDLGHIYHAGTTDLQHEEPASLLLYTQQDQYSLTVIQTTLEADITEWVRDAATPALLLRGMVAAPFRRVLLCLRGHAPDLTLVNWIVPLLHAYHSEIAVLAVTAPKKSASGLYSGHSLAAFLDAEQAQAQHLSACVRHLSDAGVKGYLKLCQGDPQEQIRHEFTTGGYTLLVLVSEATGDFVMQTVEHLRGWNEPHALLIGKPTLMA